MQKGGFQNGGNKKKKARQILKKMSISYPLIRVSKKKQAWSHHIVRRKIFDNCPTEVYPYILQISENDSIKLFQCL